MVGQDESDGTMGEAIPGDAAALVPPAGIAPAWTDALAAARPFPIVLPLAARLLPAPAGAEAAATAAPPAPLPEAAFILPQSPPIAALVAAIAATGAAIAAADAAFAPPAVTIPLTPTPVAQTPVAQTPVAQTPVSATPPAATLVAATAGAAPVASAAATPLTTEAVVPQPAAPGQVVGLVLQNPTSAPLAARYITFGMQFAAGQVPSGQGLLAELGGGSEPVQMDVKTRYADGSVQSAVLTMLQPALAAGAATPVMLAIDGAPARAAPLDISALANAAGFDLTVSLTHVTQNTYSAYNTTTPDGSTVIPDVTVNVGHLLAQALTGGSGVSLTYWLQGPQATQVRIDTGQIAGTPLHLTFDITLYADGSTSVQIGVNNDIAMQAGLGSQPLSLTYNVAVTQNGAAVVQQNNVAQWQYQDWTTTVTSNGAPQVNVQRDIAALERTGMIQTYDLTTGVATSLITADTAAMQAASTYGILGAGGLTTAMTATGARADIGPQPQYDTTWLLTQNAAAGAYALAQANEAGSIPWNLYDPGTGSYLTVTNYPTLWYYYNPPAGERLYQQYGATNWQVDPAHQPDLAYTAYLMTGNLVYLDDLNAEASADIIASWPYPRQNSAGILGGANEQVRWQAWTLREVVEAAALNPDGSAEKAYFTQIATNNIRFFLQEAQSAGEGALSGWFPGHYTAGVVPPWEQDYLATTLGMAAGLGIPGAASLLAWMSNWVAGLYLNGANGFSPADGADYNLQAADAATGVPFTTWAQLDSASAAAGLLGNGTITTDTVYQALARAALAECITYAGSTEAMQAYGWLMANTQLATVIPQQDPTFDIVPRLADGNLLTNSQVFIRNDTSSTPTTVQETNADQMIYENGSGPVTLVGGAGTNILIGGGGATTLIGGQSADYLFAGSGATTFESGGGNDFMQAGSGGSGADLFVLSRGDLGNDIIAGFRIGTDHLRISGAAPGTAALQGLIAAATQDAGGDAVLVLAPRHGVVLQGIALSQVTATLFA